MCDQLGGSLFSKSQSIYPLMSRYKAVILKQLMGLCFISHGRESPSYAHSHYSAIHSHAKIFLSFVYSNDRRFGIMVLHDLDFEQFLFFSY